MKDYSGDFIPSMAEIQTGVFKKSLMGPFVKDNLGMLLINGTVQVKKASDGVHR